MKFNFLIALIFSASLAHAFPVATQPRPLSPSPFATGYDFEGIVALSNCSGSLVQFEGQPDTDRAYVLTNGHCYEGGFPSPNTFIYQRASSRSFTILSPDARDVGRIRATHAVYVTMTKTDVSLYRVRETYAEIKARFNTRPLVISSRHPLINTPIEIISGYWRRGYTCNIDTFVYKLSEGGWEDSDSIRYTNPGCDVIGGTSGSPITERGTRTVIGINNTGNESGGRCTENNPCEIDEKGNVYYKKDLNYGQQTYWFYSCLNNNYEIDINKPGCELPH